MATASKPGRRLWVLFAGLAAFAIGAAAVVAAGELRLDVEKALTGGVYLKDPYRVTMLYAGIVLAVVGAAAVIASALQAPATVSIPTGAVCAVASATMLAFGALVFVGLSEKQRDSERSAQQESTPAPDVNPTFEEPAVDPDSESAAGAPAPDPSSEEVEKTQETRAAVDREWDELGCGAMDTSLSGADQRRCDELSDSYP